MSVQQQIRTEITQQIIDAIEKNGNLPWRRPWQLSKNTGRPANFLTRRAYTGVNPLLLELHTQRFDFRSRWFGTFNQWHQAGGRVKQRPADVKPGQWGAKIVLFRPVSKTVIDPQTGVEDEERFFVLRYFTVFCADQVEGAAVERYHVTDAELQDQQAVPDYEPAESLLQACGADIRHGGDRAFYRLPSPEGSYPHHTSGDFIVLPPKAHFHPANTYYETAIHEAAHWTEPRLGIDRQKISYAECELIAEIASCYVCRELGVPSSEELGNHAAYVGDWLRQMKGDASYVFRASSKASRATDYLMSFVRQPEPEPVAVGAEGNDIPF